jgi:hypothetical protein
MAALNVQTQERFSWPRKLVVAKAYVDQLERSGALPADRISALRQGILNAEKSKLGSKDVANLKTLAASVESGAGTAKNVVDAARMQALADVLEQPERS